MKKSILPMLALGAFMAGNILTATPAEARMGYHGNNSSYTGVNLTAEQQTQMDALAQEHFSTVQPIRNQLDEKMLELRMLSSNPNTTPETISALTKEVSNLRTQLDKENTAFRTKLESQGFSSGNMGMGMGHRGMGNSHNGNGYGRGGHNGGHW